MAIFHLEDRSMASWMAMMCFFLCSPSFATRLLARYYYFLLQSYKNKLTSSSFASLNQTKPMKFQNKT